MAVTPRPRLRSMKGAGRARRPPPAARVEKDELPVVAWHVMAQDVNAAVVATDLEVPVLRVEPAVELLFDHDSPRTEDEGARVLVGAVTGVRLHVDLQ